MNKMPLVQPPMAEIAPIVLAGALVLALSTSSLAQDKGTPDDATVEMDTAPPTAPPTEPEPDELAPATEPGPVELAPPTEPDPTASAKPVSISLMLGIGVGIDTGIEPVTAIGFSGAILGGQGDLKYGVVAHKSVATKMSLPTVEVYGIAIKYKGWMCGPIVGSRHLGLDVLGETLSLALGAFFAFDYMVSDHVSVGAKILYQRGIGSPLPDTVPEQAFLPQVLAQYWWW